MKQFQQIVFGVLVGLLASGLILLIAKPENGDPITLIPAPTPTATSRPLPTKTTIPIIVQIEGEVIQPGLYSMPQYSRLGDLIVMAGGLTTNANEKLVNLALLLRDSDYIFIPAEGQEIPEIARNSQINFVEGQESFFQYPININEATQEALESLPGIGPTKAASIIEYRQKIGEFKNLDELLEISGIGPATLESLRDYLFCEP